MRFLFRNKESITYRFLCEHRQIGYFVCHYLLICKQYAFVTEIFFGKLVIKSIDLASLVYKTIVLSAYPQRYCTYQRNFASI